LKGENVAALYKSKPSPSPKLSVYYTLARNILLQYHADVIEGKKDINTAFREAEEAINAKLAEVAGK
jgi:hypothetical protein